MKRSTVWKRALVRKEALAVTVLLPLLTAAGADAQLSGSCGLVEPPGQCDNLPPQAYVEKSWGYLINARTAVEQTNWTCQGLPQLSGTFNPDPADRCYIDVPANKTVDQTANRHIFNGAKPVYVETKDGLQKYIVYYVQQNNSTGASQNGVWADPEGPASWIENGGDEFIVFEAEATDCGARGVGLTLRNDHMRPDNGHNWQFKSAFWEKDRGANGKMTVFVKETIDDKVGGTTIILVNKIQWQRVNDPFDLKPNNYQTVLWNCQNPCPECVTSGMNGTCATSADVHDYRLTDIHMVDNETPGSFWDAVGFLTWYKDGVGYGNTPIRIDKTLRLYAVRDENGNWQQFDWGDRLDIELERTLNGRAINFHKLVHFSGVSYQLWQEGLTAPSGNHPCDLGFGTAPQPTQTYLDNRAQYSASGSTLEVYSLDGLDPFLDDPATLQQVLAHVTGPWDVSSRVRDHQFPSDYPAAITWISGFLQLPPQGNQVIGNRYVYAGTRDPLICEFPNGPHKGTGKGVFWGWFVFPDEDCSSPVGVP